jgi:hypothetical protein
VRAAHDNLTRAARGFLADHPGDIRTLDQVRSDLALTALLGDLRTGKGWTAPPDPPVTVHLVLPLGAFRYAGATDADPGGDPAELLGHGPLPTGLAFDLLAHPVTGQLRNDVTFTRWLTDDGGVVTATGSRTYRPSAPVDRTVRARDLTFRFPGCRARAHRTHARPDLDHVTPWPRGTTSAANLAVLCRRHHTLKTRGAWTAVMTPATGALTWTSPTGHTYTTHPPQWPTGP